MPAEPYDSEGNYYELAETVLTDVAGTIAQEMGWCIHRPGCDCHRDDKTLREALQEILDLPLGAFAADSKGIAKKALEWEQEVEPGGVTPY